MDKTSVAVIGAGPIGLAALKCLREEGFAATAFEGQDDVGGIWNHSPDPSVTTCLPDTVLNSSRYVSNFSDFPFPSDYPTYPPAPLMHRYFKSYAEHFGLYDHIEFNCKGVATRRDDEKKKWLVTIQSTKDGSTRTLEFDKVILAHGTTHTPVIPKFEGSEKFAGSIIHGQAYKGAEPFANKNVLVLGIGNTAADIAVDVTGAAAKVYLSHRRGAVVLSRFRQGIPVELNVNYQVVRLMNWLEDNLPSVNGALLDVFTRSLMRKSWEVDPAWGLDPPPPMLTTLPCVNEQLIPQLAAGKIASVKGLRRFLGPRSVELDDGTVLADIDAVVMGTGYTPDMSIAPWIGSATPKSRYGGAPMPNLYMQVFPPEHRDSFACLNVFSALDCVWVLAELTSMAIAQLWSGRASFPPDRQIARSVAVQTEAAAALWRRDPSVLLGAVRAGEFYAFAHTTAGTGLRGALGWGLDGWRFWWREREMARLMSWGVVTPFMLRVVDTGRRKAWSGARDAVRKANEDAKRLDRTVTKFLLKEADTKEDRNGQERAFAHMVHGVGLHD